MTLLSQTALGQAVNLDQGRNGPPAAPISPVAWVNGNLNASQAHYLEGWSIPYRVIMTDLPIGSPIELILAYDVRQSSKHAIDYLTHYQRMDDPTHGAPYFPHEDADGEEVLPLLGTVLDGAPGVTMDTEPIPVPPGTGTVSYAPGEPENSWLSNQAEAYMTLWGGSFATSPAIDYPNAADLTAKSSIQQIRIKFVADSTTAVLAWGGHIASRYDWGINYDSVEPEPNSAGGISGSSYHMRLVDWNLGNLGNTDRSLSAAAVITLPPCEIVGDGEVCYDGSPFDFSLSEPATSYQWEVKMAGANSYIIDDQEQEVVVLSGGDTQTASIDVLVPPTPSKNQFLVMVTFVRDGLENSCEFLVTVKPNPVCDIIKVTQSPVFLPNTDFTFQAPAGMDSYSWSLSAGSDATITSATNLQEVTIHTDSVSPGSFTLNLTIEKDGCSSSCSTGLQGFQDSTVPDITCPSDLTVECDGSTDPADTGTATATDVGGIASISYSDVVTGGDCPDSYTIARTWTATDTYGNIAQCTQTITVQDTTNPVLAGCPSDVTVECDAVPDPASPTATDNCDDDVEISYSEVRTDGNCPENYTLTRTWTATDNCGNTDTCTQVITVQDTTAPVLSGVPGDTTVQCDNIPDAASPSASDNCDPSPSVNLVEVSTKGECADNYTITRTWTATDCAGNSSSQSQVITVQDTTAPVLSGVPGDSTVECDNIPDAASPSASDNCDPSPSVNLVEVSTKGECADNYTITRTWTATDCAGNSSSQSQVITVQ
ncbi:MAG: hypothetical protein AB3N64_00005, partial [Puniceicoccaceae bacterium]